MKKKSVASDATDTTKSAVKLALMITHKVQSDPDARLSHCFQHVTT